MAGFLSAHGYDPGPVQRPYSTGALSGVVATLPALALLHAFGSLEVEASILGISSLSTVALGWLAMAAAGAAYARLFGRAANNLRVGWLFGMAYGFLLWTAGAVMVLPVASGGLVPAAGAAVGLFLSLVAWGAALGLLVPLVHRPLTGAISKGAQLDQVGPAAAAEASSGPRGPIGPRRP